MTQKINLPPQEGTPSDVERIKARTNYLRGSIAESIDDILTGGMNDDDNRLMKFHGSYMQDDRDLRNERQKQKLEPAYQFMVRVRAAGGIVDAKQWLAMDRIARELANGSIRLTTRQSFQLHGVLKWHLKQSISDINEALLETLAACGDVNRNVMCNPNPYQSEAHAQVYEWAKLLSEHLLPSTKAYHEIWLDGEKVIDSQADDIEQEPIYGALYLPRKFKIGIAVPPSNDVDVFSQDLGLIAILEEGKLIGFNIAIGGGMGMTYGDTDTYPQLARVIGFCPPEQIVEVAEKIVTIQRDYGNRSVRKYARFKYTVDRLGLEWVKEELHKRLGWQLQEARPYSFEHNGDRYGWIKGSNGKWHYTLFIQNGRVADLENQLLMTGLREIANVHTGDFRITPNQNLIIGNVTSQKKRKIDTLIEKYSLTAGEGLTAIRRNAMSCVSLPTCGLAMAEAERYFPSLLSKLELIIDDAGLRDQEIVIRMTGCPNGCARPALGEIAFIGKAPGRYNVYLGAGFAGDRLNKLYRENIDEKEILSALGPIIHHYAKERQEAEHFGDFVIRSGYVKEVNSGLDYHD